MNLYQIIRVLVLLCVISEGLAWWSRGSRSSSRSSSSSSSSRRNAAPQPKPKPESEKPKSGGWFFGKSKSDTQKTTETKPKDSGKSGGWFFGKAKETTDSKPKESEKPKSGGWFFGKSQSDTQKTTETKPKDSGKSGGWFFGKAKETTESKPKDSGKSKSGWWFSDTPKPNPKSETKPESKPIPEVKEDTQPETDMKKVIEEYEGTRLTAYDAQPKNTKVHDTTIGIGFNLNRPDAKETFEKTVPGVNFDDVKSGKKSITKEQARALFNHDIDTIYEPRAKDKIGKDVYDKLPSNVKAAVVNAVYRGDLGPKTSKLIKEGKWEEVGKEYLDHEQYKNADQLGIPGVKSRMDWNKEQFDSMIKKNSQQQPLS